MGRLPIYLYNDIPWVPYLGTKISIESYGFIAQSTLRENNIVEMIHGLANMTQEEYEHKVSAVRKVRHYFTYDGLLEQIDYFIKDPFGPAGGYLRCTPHPRTDKCCD